LIDLPDLPVECNRLWETKAAAEAAARANMRLSFCGACGHLFNSAFDPSLMDYSTAYDTSLHASARFRDYADALAVRLIERYGLSQKRIVEIGCGQGEFLDLICAKGANRGFGFDESYAPEGRIASRTNLVFENAYFSNAHTDLNGDFLYARHVLEHLENPVDFLREIKAITDQWSHVEFYFEVPNGLFTLRDMGIWDLIYEHRSYFWAGSLNACFRAAGFRMRPAEAAYGDQFLGIESDLPNDAAAESTALPMALSEVTDLAHAFARNYTEKKADWTAKVRQWRSAGERVVAWGAGSKGVTFLNVVDPLGEVFAIVDLNTSKHGCFTPCSGHRVIGPQELQVMKPDHILLMNPLYKQEVAADLARLGVTAEIYTV
jgi:SAM-dependent methyltransferase